MKINAIGIVGNVYKTQTGLEEYNQKNLPDFGSKGWEQITPNMRRLVVRKYSNSKRVIWIAQRDEEVCRPMNHKEDGELF